MYRKLNLPKDNPNSDAKIGFFCWSPFHYYVYKNIYGNLPNAEFIVGEKRYIENVTYQQNVKSISNFLSQKKVFWRLYDKNMPYKKHRDFFLKYQAVVSVWPLPAYYQGFLDGILKIRVLYGNAKDLYNFGTWSADFELILSYGEYSQKYLSIFTLSQIVGNPKFDDWFNNSLDTNTINYLRNNLDPSKKTILYTPTHDTQKGMSSLPILLQEYLEQAKNFNFLIKLHYLTSIDEPESIEKLKTMGCMFFDETTDILPLLKVCDIVLSDNSGAIFDAVLAQKSIVLFETDEKVFRPNFFIGNRGVTGLMTYPNSLEQQIKKSENAVGPLIQSLNDLPDAISEIDKKNEFFKKNAEKIRTSVFGYQDGLCGKRAASAIQNLIENFDTLASQYPWPYYTTKRNVLLRSGQMIVPKMLPFWKKIKIFFELYF